MSFITTDDFDEMVWNLAKRDGKVMSENDRLAMGGLGISGEAGEVTDIIKKVLYHGLELDDGTRELLLKELGDVQWYNSLLAQTVGSSSQDVMQMNYDKLLKRYPNGFSKEASENRVE